MSQIKIGVCFFCFFLLASGYAFSDDPLRFLPSGSDEWMSEKVNEELGEILSKIAKELSRPAQEGNPWQPYLDSGFLGTPLSPQTETLLREGPKLQVYQAVIATPRGSGEWLEDVLKWRQTFTSFEAKFKIEHISVESDQAITQIRLECFGLRLNGAHQGIVGRTQVTWKKRQQWMILSFMLERLERTVLHGKRMTDITAAALRQAPQASMQLGPGLDTWRGVLDEATGIDVYGHHGLTVGDVNGDGWDDFYVLQPGGLPNRLFVNQQNGTFTDVTDESGVGVLDPTPSALFADIDNDGDADLLVFPQVSAPILFRNDRSKVGEIRLTPMPRSVFQRKGSPLFGATSAAMADYDNDGFLDLYLCFYTFYRHDQPVFPTPYFDAENGPQNILYRNNGHGTFIDVTEETGLNVHNSRFSFSAAFADYNDDGHMDLYVANDFGRNNLYRNNGNGTFTDIAAQAGVEDIAAGMSAAWGDYDSDGDLDLYVGNMWSSAGLRLTFQEKFQSLSDPSIRSLYQRHAKGNSLFRNESNGAFTDVSAKSNTEVGRWAWGSDFVDLDRDGHLDILIMNGFVTGTDTNDL